VKLGVVKGDDIHILELLGVACAVQLCPTNCGLRVISDSQSVIDGIPKGGLGDKAREIVRFIQNTCIRKSVNLSLKWVSTLINPADHPSRHICSVIATSRPREFLGCFVLAKVPLGSQEYVDYWAKRRNSYL